MPQFYTKSGKFVSFENAAEHEQRLWDEADEDGRGTIFWQLTGFDTQLEEYLNSINELDYGF